ncbi:unknown function [Klebsiella phage vB_Kpl_K59PH2]|uniref:Uncharacterized protein n=1 Tax=Klebsiella phage vB_Kpl_K59PH2 TaxID=3071671 RepID=A0AAD2JTE2_9CAUD|nr:unknown function [Klebsiella phage vB_Kpl_K59PH2]
MTKEMREFLTAWLAWAEDPDAYDSYDGGPFKKRTGLCSNIDELHGMLEADGLDTLYPFDTEQSYDTAFSERTQHLNPARLAWVRAKLEASDE